MRLQKIFRIALVLILVLPGISRAAGASDAGAVIDKLHAALLSAMKGGATLGYKGRYDLIAPTVKSSFDFPTISRIVMGRYWSKLDAKQKAQFIDTFSELSIATYASQFDAYSGEQFKDIGVNELKDGRVVVRSEIVGSDGGTTKLDYLLNRTGGRWEIINVVADGVSDISLKRAEYSAVMRNDGFNALLEKIKGKIAAYAKPS